MSLSMQRSESSIMARNVIHTTALETRTQVVPSTGMVRNALLATNVISESLDIERFHFRRAILDLEQVAPLVDGGGGGGSSERLQ